MLHWIASTGYYVNPENREEIELVIRAVIRREPAMRDERTIGIRQMTPLQLALSYGTWYLAMGLINNGAAIRGINPSALQLLIRTQSATAAALETLKLLLTKGIKIDEEYGGDGNALCECGTVAVARMLIEAGVDAFHRDSLDRSVLFYCQSAQVVEYLVNTFALDPTALDARGRNALHECRTLEVAKLLVEKYSLKPVTDSVSPSQDVTEYLAKIESY